MLLVFFVSSSILFAVCSCADVGIAERACGSVCIFAMAKLPFDLCRSYTCPEGSRCVNAGICFQTLEFNREICNERLPECDIGGPVPCGAGCVPTLRDFDECFRILCPPGTECTKPAECSYQASVCQDGAMAQCEPRITLTHSPTASPSTSLSPTHSPRSRRACPCKCSFRRSKFRRLKRRCRKKPLCMISRCLRVGRRRRGLQCCES